MSVPPQLPMLKHAICMRINMHQLIQRTLPVGQQGVWGPREEQQQQGQVKVPDWSGKARGPWKLMSHLGPQLGEVKGQEVEG